MGGYGFFTGIIRKEALVVLVVFPQSITFNYGMMIAHDHMFGLCEINPSKYFTSWSFVGLFLSYFSLLLALFLFPSFRLA